MKSRIILTLIIVSFQLIVLPPVVLLGRELLDTLNMEIVSVEYFLSLFTIDTYVVSFVEQDPLNYVAWAVTLITALGILFDFFGNSVGEKKKFDDRDIYGSHGTARWQTDREMESTYLKDGQEGWFFGHYKQMSYNPKTWEKLFAVHSVQNKGKLNSQVTVIGPPGSQKTTGFIYPNIFHLVKTYKNSDEKPDLIITDPKSEILTETANYLEDNGYEVKVLDFINLKYGDALNPLDLISEEKEIMQVASGYVSAAQSAKKKGSGGGSKDPVWENGAALILGALIGFMQQKYPKERRTFEEAAELLTSKSIRDPEQAETFFKNNEITGVPLSLYKKFLLLEDRMRSSVLAGLGIDMTLFSIPGIQDLTGKTTVDVTKLGRKKDKPIALFILMKDEDRTFSPVINSVLTAILSQLYKNARETGSKLEVPIFLMIEEMANIGRIDGLLEKLGTMRGRRIFPMMIWQSMSQMKDRYGESWEDLISQCDSMIVLGSNDKFTSNYVSEKVGKTTIKVQGISKQAGTVMDRRRNSETMSYQQRPILFPDEVERFNNDKLILMQRSRFPVQLYKTQYEYWIDKNRLAKAKSIEDFPLVKDHYDSEEKAPEVAQTASEREVLNSSTNGNSEEINQSAISTEEQEDNNQEEEIVVETDEDNQEGEFEEVASEYKEDDDLFGEIILDGEIDMHILEDLQEEDNKEAVKS